MENYSIRSILTPYPRRNPFGFFGLSLFTECTLRKRIHCRHGESSSKYNSLDLELRVTQKTMSYVARIVERNPSNIDMRLQLYKKYM